METTRHFTATTYIVHQDRVLLHWHKKLICWLPPGGHIDRDELPETAALREVKEETGLTVRLYNPNTPLDLTGDSTRQLVRPVHLLLEQINPFHQHIDLIYYATVSGPVRLEPAANETTQLRWFSASDLTETEMPLNVRVCALEALRLVNSE
ncbi:MAG: NUDIX domain-containing protein [Chloroflexota bacterium]|jgi:8-oxo-dGTP pyrophosphatase MutT (NUDIX family)